MIRRRQTTEIADLIEDRLNHGAGPHDITIDQIVIAYHEATKLALKTSQETIRRHLDTALASLERDRGWLWVKVTNTHFVLLAAGVDSSRDAMPDEDRRRCLAGLGRAQSTHGIHFCTEKQDCLLFIEARIAGIKTGSGMVGANARRIETAANQGQISGEGINRVVLLADVRANRPARHLKRAIAAAKRLSIKDQAG